MSIKGLKYFALTLSLALSMASAHSQQRVVLDKVVAVVGGSAVLRSEVDDYVRLLGEQAMTQGYTSDRDPLSEAIEELMTQRLLYTQALIDSIEVDNSMVNSQVDMQVNAMIEAAGGIAELERAHNMEVFNIRQILYNRIRERSLADMMRSEVVSRITTTPGEVEQFYKNLDRKSLPMIGDQYRYAQITRFPESMEEARRRVREELLSMRERIINGTAQFSSLAQMYSVDPGSAYRGGMMEPQPANAFTEPFANALEALQVGQVSEVIETEFGYHIVELLDKKGNLYSCRHILLRPSYTAEELMEPIYFLDSLATEIRDNTISFAQAALEYSDDAMSKMNGGVVTNQDLLERYNANDARLTETKFLREDFGQGGYKSLEDYLQLIKLKEGEISNAFTTQDLLGNQLTKIVKLEELYPAHEASLNEDYLVLEAMALSSKQQNTFDTWLSEHIRSTYITINKDYRDLEFKNPNWVK